MANDYFDSVPVAIPEGTRARASQVNAVSQSVEAGFDKLPTENEIKQGLTRYAVDTGVANAYVVTLPYAPTLVDGFNLTFKAVNANTGASTVNVNGTGVKAIRNADGSELIANTFGANTLAQIIYNATTDQWQLLSQSPEAEAAKTAAEAAAAAAAISESNAATSETNAAASAAAASTSETNAATSEANAATSETNAATSETNADASFLSFDARYLGSKASDPTLDNQGGALIDGALYWNTTVNEIRVYDLGGTSWAALTNSGNATSLDGLDSTQFMRFDAVNNSVTTGTTTGQAHIFTEPSLTSGRVMSLVTGSATATGEVLNVQVAAVAATADGILITNSGTGAGINVTADGTGDALAISTSTGAGDAIAITHASGGLTDAAISVSMGVLGRGIAATDSSTSIGGAMLLLDSQNSTRTQPIAVIDQSNSGGSGNVLEVANAGSGDTLQVNVDGPGRGIRAYSNQASRTTPLVEVINDNATGSGGALAIQQDQGGSAISVTHGGSADGVTVTATGSGNAISAFANAAGIRAADFYSNESGRTVPVVSIASDNPLASSAAALRVQQDNLNATALEIVTNGGDGITIDGVPVGAGGAGLGANTFTGTQEIDTGADAGGTLILKRTNTTTPAIQFDGTVDFVIESNLTGGNIDFFVQDTGAAREKVMRMGSLLGSLTGFELYWNNELAMATNKNHNAVSFYGAASGNRQYQIAPEFGTTISSENWTNDTTYREITDLAVTTVTSAWYEYYGWFYFSTITDAKFRMDFGTCSATFKATAIIHDSTGPRLADIYHEGTGLWDVGDLILGDDAATNQGAWMQIQGWMFVSTGGAINIDIAQNVASGVQLRLEIGAFVKLNRHR